VSCTELSPGVAMIPVGTSGQASRTEGSGDEDAIGLGEPLGDALADAVGSPVADADAEGVALREAVGRAVAVAEAETGADGDALAVGVGVTDADSTGAGVGVIGSVGDDGTGLSEANTSVGDADAISPERAVSAASNALLAISLGNDVGAALAEADSLTDVTGDGVLISDADADAEDVDEGTSEGEAVAVAEADALDDIDGDDDALADGEALPIGSTMQGS